MLTVKSFPSFCAILLSLTGALFLSVESYLNHNGHSICTTSACELVGKYLSIPEPVLITLGATAFFLLFLLLYFTTKYHKSSLLPLALLLPCMSFDGVLIGYQIFTINEFCILCFGVATLLLIIVSLYSFEHRSLLIFFISIVVWIGSFSAAAIIDIPPPSNVFRQMAFLSTQGPSTNAEEKPTVTLIFSMKCPHCQELISFISQSNYTAVNWRLASTDIDDQSISKINIFLDELTPDLNIFKQLMIVKEETASPPTTMGKASTLSKNKKTQSFMTNIGINSVPTIVIETPENKMEVIWGAEMARKQLQLLFNSHEQ